jgi:diguanylate cyclase
MADHSHWRIVCAQWLHPGGAIRFQIEITGYSLMLVGHYNPQIVLLSLLVAIAASYAALGMVGRIATTQGRAVTGWLAGGAFAMGAGIWSMHFVGMLAFSLPIPLGYDPGVTLLSLLIAIALSAFGLWLLRHDTLPMSHLGCGAVLMGIGIAGMHYTGMAAMDMAPAIRYVPWLVALSILIAVIASGAVLWIAFRLRKRTSHVWLLRLGASVVMGGAIVAMHYTGMAAAQFPVGSVCGAATAGMDSGWLALVISIFALAVLGIALITSVLDLRLESRTLVLATSLAAANEELTYLALHDNLTKLPNRLLLEDRINQAMQVADRSERMCSLMFLDLDGFKSVNDAYGHYVGDQLLIQVAQRIREIVDAKDTIARVGGDEFVLVAEVNDPSDAATLADNLLEAIQQPFTAANHELRVSTSIGIAMYPGDGTHQRDLLMHADAAMYHAKSIGRNAYCFFEASMNVNVHEQLQLMQDLRAALKRQELVLHYQPKFEAPNGPIIGVEALVRWMHPTQGIIGPDRFIPLAEKVGLIIPLGTWVLNEACRQMRAWHDAGHRHWSIAVNLSASQFSHANLVQTVRETLARHGLDPHCLILEVTESTAMRNAEESVRILHRLDSMGVRISIDDFGTGYSSLLYLKRLPASELKIDRGFIRDLQHDTEDAAIVSAIVALGRALDLKIVAEGVETSEQQQFLTQLGCNSLQGYLLGRPMPAEALTQVAAV